MKTIVIKWSTEDVLAMAESMDVELTETQADIILDNLLKYHDANVGINWDVINFHIENFIEKTNGTQII
jgi:hypothetical protein